MLWADSRFLRPVCLPASSGGPLGLIAKGALGINHERNEGVNGGNVSRYILWKWLILFIRTYYKA